MKQPNTVLISGHDLSPEDVERIACHGATVRITEAARKAIAHSHAIVREKAENGQPTYGISTGFGELSKVFIPPQQNKQLQRNLILSHACGVGEPFSIEQVRAMMVLRLNTLCSGYSGVSPPVPELLADLLNHGIVPFVPCKGSLGASGDLANLAHIALVLIGEGQAYYHGELLAGRDALAACKLQPVELCGKDGLAIINGTQIMAGLGTLHLLQAERLWRQANQAAALTTEALCGLTSAFDERIHRLRPHPGQLKTAAALRAYLKGSDAVNTRRDDVQDAYTLRCVPQVHGATYDVLRQVRDVLEIEINSVTDNPLVFPNERDVISGGNFHGQPLALQMDFLGIAVAELANISERRIERLVNPALNEGLPAFLSSQSGIYSGLMIPQYTAACLVSENKVLAHPASVDSIPSSANKEDHVSMGAIAARKAGEIIKNTRYVLAIEWICAAQAIDLRKIKHLGAMTSLCYDFTRQTVATLTEDRVLHHDLENMYRALLEGGPNELDD